MQLISKYVRENKRYSRSELKKLFSLSDSEFSAFVDELTSMNVLRKHDPEDTEENELLLDDDITTNNSTLYYFKYVGILLCKKRIIKVYPKCYLSSVREPVNDLNNRPDDRMKVVLDVIQKYKKKKNKIYHEQNADNKSVDNNLLGLMVFLLGDYFDNGIYTNSEEINEINGEGPINWTKTINECVPLIQDDTPYYIDTYTIKNTDDENDYFTKLHAYVISDCSRQLEDAKLSYLFGFDKVDISDDYISDFGQPSYILNKLNLEMNVQYETRKLQVLKALYEYIAEKHDSKINNTDTFKMYGTTAFYKIWEEMCQSVFGDVLKNKTLAELPITLISGDNGTSKLIDIIQKPKWVTGATPLYASRTFEPDAVTIDNISGVKTFIIMDAKYYNLQLEAGKPLKGNPGVEDVAKQYLYQLAYQEFLKNHSITEVRNCFLMPTDKDSKEIKGYAELDILSGLGLQNIKIRLIPIDYMMQLYLENKDLPISYLELDK